MTGVPETIQIANGLVGKQALQIAIQLVGMTASGEKIGVNSSTADVIAIVTMIVTQGDGHTAVDDR